MTINDNAGAAIVAGGTIQNAIMPNATIVVMNPNDPSFTVKAITVAVIGNVTSFENQEIPEQELEEIDCVYGVSFTTITDLPNVTMTIKDLEDDKPEGIPDVPSDHIFGYLEMTLTSNNETVDDSVIQSLEINFTVRLSWFTENNRTIDKENITLMRYHDGAWEKLITEYLEEDSTYAYYRATSTGASTFAIVGGEIVYPTEFL